MLTEDYNFLGKSAVKALTDLRIIPPRCTDTSTSYGECQPTVFVTNAAGPDERLLSAAEVGLNWYELMHAATKAFRRLCCNT